MKFLLAIIISLLVLTSCGTDSDDNSETGDSSSEDTTESAEQDRVFPSVLIEGDVAVAVVDNGVDGPDETILFLHGASFTKEDWSELGIFDKVGDASIPAIAIDLPGNGETPESQLDNGAFLKEAIFALGLEPENTVIVAPSLAGSYVHPYLDLEPDALLAGYVPIAPIAIDSFGGRDEDKTFPALLTWAQDDAVVTIDKADELAEKLPGAQIKIFEGSNHAFYTDVPDEFADALISFVEGL